MMAETKGGKGQDVGTCDFWVVADKSGREYGEDVGLQGCEGFLLRAGKTHLPGIVPWFGMERGGRDLPLPQHPWPSVGTGISFLGKIWEWGGVHCRRVGLGFVSLIKAGKETKSGEGEAKEPPLSPVTQSPKTRIQMDRQTERQAEVDSQGHPLTPTDSHMHTHTHTMRNGRRESQEARRRAGERPSTAVRGIVPPTTTCPSPAHHYQGPAGRLHPGTLSAQPCWPRVAHTARSPRGSGYKQSCYMCKRLEYI